MNVRKIIEKSILSYSKRNYKGLIPYPTTITSHCLLGGIEAKWGKEETYPRASPLTLTGVTKGPRNRGKGKEIEVEEERGYEKCNELASSKSPPQRQQDFQESQSPNKNAFSYLRQTRQKQAEGSRHQCNNAELMEMLKSLKQEMKERNDQLKI